MSEASFEDMLSSVIGNEALMGKISSIMSSHGGNQDESLGEVIEAISSSIGTKSSESEKSESTSEIKSDAKEAILKGMPNFSRNAKLLSALRPYLSEKRAQMVDSILRLEQLAEIMKLTR